MVCKCGAARAATLVMLWMAAGASELRAVAQDAETPPLELLEFLGQWETEDGEWISPEDIEYLNLAELMRMAEQQAADADDDDDDEILEDGTGGNEIDGDDQSDGGSDDDN